MSERRTVSGELGKISGALGRVLRPLLEWFMLLRPLLFAAGLGFAMFGLGVALTTHLDDSAGPGCMAFGGVLVGVSGPWWGPRR
jgi:hypothetical protein